MESGVIPERISIHIRMDVRILASLDRYLARRPIHPTGLQYTRQKAIEELLREILPQKGCPVENGETPVSKWTQ